MTIVYKSVVVALALAGAAAMSGCVVRDTDHDRFGEIGFGYNDGYWDNGHHWHQWDNDNERASYRTYQGNHYYDWKHDRDADNGWHDGPVVGISVGFADIGFGYNDGYWDHTHHWHNWANDSERDSYRTYQGNHYYDWKHDRDADDGWHTN